MAFVSLHFPDWYTVHMIFGQPKKRVTEREFEEIRHTLQHELDQREWTQVEMLFHGALHEHGLQKGIDKAEFKAGLTWLKENKNRHSLSDSELTALEEAFAEHLRD